MQFQQNLLNCLRDRKNPSMTLRKLGSVTDQYD
jgi:hypothetical protein